MWEIEASVELLTAIGGAPIDPSLREHLPTLAKGGVHTAPTGLIQDPAGAAIGIDVPPRLAAAGGASGAIYRAFPDLEPIPPLTVGDSVLNGSSGAGARILHTHSPVLTGDPSSDDDVVTALRDLVGAYHRAIEVGMPATTPTTGADPVINLVPVSGRIFAGPFRDPAIDHLHPSYTLAAVIVALNRWLSAGAGDAVPATVIWIFDRAVFDVAQQCLATWQSITMMHPGV